MDAFDMWLKANLAASAFAAEQLRLEAERRQIEEERAYLRLELAPPMEFQASSFTDDAE